MIILFSKLFVFSYAALCMSIAAIAFGLAWAKRSQRNAQSPERTTTKG